MQLLERRKHLQAQPLPHFAIFQHTSHMHSIPTSVSVITQYHHRDSTFSAAIAYAYAFVLN